MKHGTIRYRTDTPDLSGIDFPAYEWCHSVYGDVKEVIPQDAPEPLGKVVTQISYVDANLAHNLLTGQ